MGQNVFEQLKDQKPALVNRIIQSQGVAQIVMAYLTLFRGLSLKFSLPIEGLSFGPVVGTGRDGEFEAKITWSRLSLQNPQVWAMQSSFQRYIKAKAGHLALAVFKNRNIEKFFESMILTLDAWCARNSCKLGDIQQDGPPIVLNNLSALRFKVKSKSLALARV